MSLTLVFDGDCSFCTACAILLRWLDRGRQLSLVPSQAPGICRALGLTPEDCASAAWAAEEDGRLARGAEAILLGLGAATGATWIAGLYRHPGFRRAAEAVYGWVARHRGQLPGLRPYCQRHPAACGR